MARQRTCRALRPVSAARISCSSAPATKAKACSADSRAKSGADGVTRSSALPRFVKAHARIGRFSGTPRASGSRRTAIASSKDSTAARKLTGVPCSCKVMPRFIHANASRLRNSGLLSRSSVRSRVSAWSYERTASARFSGRAQPRQRIAAIHPSRGEDVTIPGVLVQRQRAPQLDRALKPISEAVRLAVVFSFSSAMPRFIQPLAMALRTSGGCRSCVA